jgi:hypothetical protein
MDTYYLTLEHSGVIVASGEKDWIGMVFVTRACVQIEDNVLEIHS